MSKLFTLNIKDFLKGLVMAILVPAVTIMQQSLDSGTLVLNWKTILIASISGVVAYLMKNFFTSDSSSLKTEDYSQAQQRAIEECNIILDNVSLELVGTRPKDR